MNLFLVLTLVSLLYCLPIIAPPPPPLLTTLTLQKHTIFLTKEEETTHQSVNAQIVGLKSTIDGNTGYISFLMGGGTWVLLCYCFWTDSIRACKQNRGYDFLFFFIPFLSTYNVVPRHVLQLFTEPCFSHICIEQVKDIYYFSIVTENSCWDC